jgi:hypothetical protein
MGGFTKERDMAGTWLAALGVASAINMGVAEAPPLDEVGKLADAIALTRACPSLQLNRETVSMTLARAGIAIAPLMAEISDRSRAMEVRYVLLEYRQACAIGRQRYGAAGTSAKGFLAER